VGQKPSKAEFYVDDYTDVISLLKSLTVVSTKVSFPPAFHRESVLRLMVSFCVSPVESQLLALGYAGVHANRE
jgi:hypothetical protein